MIHEPAGEESHLEIQKSYRKDYTRVDLQEYWQESLVFILFSGTEIKIILSNINSFPQSCNDESTDRKWICSWSLSNSFRRVGLLGFFVFYVCTSLVTCEDVTLTRRNFSLFSDILYKKQIQRFCVSGSGCLLPVIPLHQAETSNSSLLGMIWSGNSPHTETPILLLFWLYSLRVSECLGVPGVCERWRFDRGDARALRPAGKRHGVRSSGLWRTSTDPGSVCEHQRASAVQHIVSWPLLHCGTTG